MAMLRREDVNSINGLRIYFYLDGNPVNPFSVKYTIIDPAGEIVQFQNQKDALQHDVGEYFADWTVGKSAPIGSYKIIWEFALNSTDTLDSQIDEFNIVRELSEECLAIHIPSGSGMGTSPGGSGTGNSCNVRGFVSRDFYGRVKVYTI